MNCKTKKRSLTENAILNVIKQLCAMIFPFISFSYASHVLGASNLGGYSYCYSIISYFISLASLGIFDYAVREGSAKKDNKEDLSQFINQVFSINIITTLVTYFLLIIAFFSFPSLGKYRVILLIQSVSIALTTLGVDWINVIFEDYLYITIRYVLIQIMSVGLLVIFVKNENSLIIYTVITVLSAYGGNILNWKHIKKYTSIKVVKNMDFKNHIKPMLILFFKTITTGIYLNSDITMLGIMCTTFDVGQYTAASKIYTVAKSLINSMIMVTLPRFSNMITNNDYKSYEIAINKLIERITFFLLPIMIGMFVESTNILFALSGNQFIGGTVALRILSVAFVFACYSCLIAYSILIPNKLEKSFLISTTIAATSNIVLNLFLLPLYKGDGAAFTTLIAEILMFTISLSSARRIMKVQFINRNLIDCIFGSFFVAVICNTFKAFCLNNIMYILSTVAVCVPLYIIILYLLKNNVCISIVSKIKAIIGKLTELK